VLKYLKLIRIKQWIKNGFLFLPIFFDLKITEFPLLFNTILGFVSFSFVASAVYILNDFKDLKNDKQHPKKMKRPLASGDIAIKSAFSLMALLLAGAIAIGFFLPPYFLVIVGIYFILGGHCRREILPKKSWYCILEKMGWVQNIVIIFLIEKFWFR